MLGLMAIAVNSFAWILTILDFWWPLFFFWWNIFSIKQTSWNLFFLPFWTVVILLVADHPSKELLTEYTVPLGYLKPFHQYHLELVQVLSIMGHFSAFS